MPAGHAVHIVDAAPLTRPAGHATQAVLLGKPVYVLVVHELQLPLDALKNSPAGHTLHCDAFVAPAGLLAPYPHDVHSALPADENVFAEQVAQPAEVAGAATDGGRLFVTSVVDSEDSK